VEGGHHAEREHRGHQQTAEDTDPIACHCRRPPSSTLTREWP
jgi:hypothetical protein